MYQIKPLQMKVLVIVVRMNYLRYYIRHVKTSVKDVMAQYIRILYLSIIELCRLSETMVPQQIEQSLHFGGGKKKSLSSQRDLFPSSHMMHPKQHQRHSITRKYGDSSVMYKYRNVSK